MLQFSSAVASLVVLYRQQMFEVDSANEDFAASRVISLENVTTKILIFHGCGKHGLHIGGIYVLFLVPDQVLQN